MTNKREVRVLIGKRYYSMQTELDEDTLGRVAGIVNEVSGSISGAIDQEGLLMLTCLQLAYNIEKISLRLEPLNRKLNDLGFNEYKTKGV